MHSADRKSSLCKSLIDVVFHPSRVKRSLEMRKRKGRPQRQVRLFNTPGGTTLRVHPSGREADVDVPEAIAGSFRILP